MKPSFKRKILKVQYKKNNKPESWLGGWGREMLYSMQLLEIHNSRLCKKKKKSLSGSPIRNLLKDFPGGTMDKNPPANIGDMGWLPGLGRSHML